VDVHSFRDAALAAFQRRHHRLPRAIGSWRGTRTGAVRALLRACGVSFRRPSPIAHEKVVDAYRSWLIDLRGLASLSVDAYCGSARAFLLWLEAQDVGCSLEDLGAAEIDAYLELRSRTLNRVSRKTVASLLRPFMRYLHAQNLTRRDLAPAVWAPRVYEHERPPSGLKQEEIRGVLKTTRQDHSSVGRRDYAMLVLLSAYGVRACEVVHLRLEDIDWRRERLRIRHGKRGPISELPLLAHVGEALLAYLRHGRPQTTLREVFVRAKAPCDRGLRGDVLYQVVARRLRRAQIRPEGKHGPHALRHGRAVGLLRAGASMKVIGDILGHRRPASTQTYLRLQTEDLRAVALPMPGGRA
jgi:integrase/recombinase XerD